MMVAALDANIERIFGKQVFALSNAGIVHPQFAASVNRNNRDNEIGKICAIGRVRRPNHQSFNDISIFGCVLRRHRTPNRVTTDDPMIDLWVISNNLTGDIWIEYRHIDRHFWNYNQIAI